MLFDIALYGNMIYNGLLLFMIVSLHHLSTFLKHNAPLIEMSSSAYYPQRDMIMTWSAGNGRIVSKITAFAGDFKGFKRHSEWEGSTLVFRPLARKNADGL